VGIGFTTAPRELNSILLESLIQQPHQPYTRAKFDLIAVGQAFDWKPMRRGKPLNMKKKYLAEREGFEPPLPKG
jgi:hypothetical protein